MSFESPLVLIALLAVPVAVAAYWIVHRRSSRGFDRFAAPALQPNLVSRSPGWRRHLPAALLLLALTALLVGLARPQATMSVKREEATVILAVDVSRSMVATDVKPSRLAAARAAARAFLAKVPEKFRVGVVAFATSAQVASPATDDRTLTLAAIDQLRPGEGTALGDAIVRSIQVAQGAAGNEDRNGDGKPDLPPTAILLLSDGAQTQGDVAPLEGAGRARSLGIPVFTVALGTPDGVVQRQLPGGYTERITVPPDPETLKQVAAATGGQFYTAPDQEKLKAVYEQLGSRLGHRDKKEEITYAFAAGGGLLLLVSGALSALWFRRLP